MNAYIVEIAVCAVILWEFLMGLRRGLSGELFRLIGSCLVLLTGLGFYRDFGFMIANHSRLAHDPETALALAFLLIIAGMGACFFLLHIILHLVVKVKFNDAFDRPAGGIAGIARGAVLAILLVFAAGLWPDTPLRAMITEKSFAGKNIFRFAPAVTARINSLQERFGSDAYPHRPARHAPQPAEKPSQKPDPEK